MFAAHCCFMYAGVTEPYIIILNISVEMKNHDEWLWNVCMNLPVTGEVGGANLLVQGIIEFPVRNFN